MKAVVIDQPGQMHIHEVDMIEPDAGEVVVAVKATGICAGDMYIYRGKNPYTEYPVIAGHEIAGVVASLGEGVTAPPVGARVAVEPFIGCGTCYTCGIGKSNCCPNLRIIGVHQAGGFADYVKAPAPNIHPIPDNLSLAQASFAEPVAIGVQACRRAGVGAEYVLILGCGPIGLALIEVAKARGAQVVATDIDPSRLDFAARLGAETLLADDDLHQKVLDQTGRNGAPVVIEATGNAAVMESTVDLIAAGGRIVILGLVPQETQVRFPGLDFTRKEMTILGSRASVNCFPEALSLLSSGSITYPDVATEFNMWDAPDVFRHIADNPGFVHKGILTI